MIIKILNILLNIFYEIFNINKQKDNINKCATKEYCKKNIMTDYEYTFYKKILPLEESQKIKIIPQVNLATVISKKSNERYQNELYRNIDFALFNNELTELLLLIELNDSTHNTPKRKYRDIKVKEILKSASIELITFYTSYDNKEEYVQNRIKKYLTTKENDEIVIS